MSDENSLINIGDLAKPEKTLFEQVAELESATFLPYKIERAAKAKAEIIKTSPIIRKRLSEPGFNSDALTQITNEILINLRIIESIFSNLPDSNNIPPFLGKLMLYLGQTVVEFEIRIRTLQLLETGSDRIAELSEFLETIQQFIKDFHSLLNFNFETREAEFQKFSEDLNYILVQYQQKLDKLETFKTEFFNNSSERLEKFTKKTVEQLEEFTKKTDANVRKDFQSSLEKYYPHAQKQSEEIAGILDKSREMQRELSGRTLSDFFGKRASEEKKKVALWTGLTWFFAVLTILAIIISTILQFKYFAENKEFDLQFLGAKVLFSIALGLVTKWTSKRANRYLAEESKYHRLAINILTVESFTANLDEDSRKEVMKAVALKIFTETNVNESSTEFETIGVNDVVQGLISKIGK